MIPANTLATIAALSIGVMLGGCQKAAAPPPEATAAATGETAHGTLASAIAGARGLTAVSGALSETGLAYVFDGPGSYTVLAPDDAAFGKLGPARQMLADPANKAMVVAVMRDHVLPGHLTPEAIRQAIAAKNGAVTMRTLGEGTVTFDASGNTITMAGADGSKATIAGDAVTASNGVVLPIDGVLKSLAPATAAGAN